MHATRHPGRRLLITAGPTHEPIDAVRFIGNRSSGRMGLALAAAAVERQMPTTLLLGPTALEPPGTSSNGTPLIVERFRTTEDLRVALARHWPHHDVLIMAAAVADYRPVAAMTTAKLPRAAGAITIELEATEDLVAELAATSRPDQVRIGFALEAASALDDAARRKLRAKGLHAIVANPLGTMDAPDVTAALHLADGTVVPAPAAITKEAFAAWLLDRLELVRPDVARSGEPSPARDE